MNKKTLTRAIGFCVAISMSACTITLNPGNGNDTPDPTIDPQATNGENGNGNQSGINVYNPDRESNSNSGNSDDQNTNDQSLQHVEYSLGTEQYSNWIALGEYYPQMTNVSCQYIEIDEKYPNLKKFFDDRGKEDIAEYSEREKAYEEDWKENFESYGEQIVTNDVKSYLVTRSDSQIFSVTEDFYQGYGDFVDHFYQTVNVNTETGKTMGIESFVYLTDDLYEYMAEYLFEYYDNDGLYADNEDDMVDVLKDTMDYYGDSNIAVLPNGVIFIFNTYDVAAGYLGTVTVPLFFDEHPELMVEGTFVEENEEYIVRTRPDLGWYEDVDNDGFREKIDVYFISEEWEGMGEYYYTQAVVCFNGKESIESYVEVWSETIPDIYFAKNKKGDFFFYAECEAYGPGDYLYGSKYNSKTGMFESCCSKSGMIGTMDSFDHVEYTEFYGILSTFFVKADYIINDDGNIILGPGDYWAILDMEEYPLVTTQKIWGYKTDKKTLTVSDEKVDIPVGTELYFKYTDCENSIIFEDEDGQYIKIERDSKQNVCGIPEYEAFEVLWYYG